MLIQHLAPDRSPARCRSRKVSGLPYSVGQCSARPAECGGLRSMRPALRSTLSSPGIATRRRPEVGQAAATRATLGVPPGRPAQSRFCPRRGLAVTRATCIANVDTGRGDSASSSHPSGLPRPRPRIHRRHRTRKPGGCIQLHEDAATYGSNTLGDLGTWLTTLSAGGTFDLSPFAGEFRYFGITDVGTVPAADVLITGLPATTVPDGGTTALLLGMALLGISDINRRFRA